MSAYQIQNSSLRCARTGRELTPGEKYYSVLYDRGEEFIREDISREAWQGAPANAFSFWMGRVPAKDQARRVIIDDEVLIDCLSRLAAETDPQKVNFRYVIALLLMRRKRLRFEDVSLENDLEILLLRCPRTRNLYRVVNPQLTESHMAAVQEEVQKVLGVT